METVKHTASHAGISRKRDVIQSGDRGATLRPR